MVMAVPTGETCWRCGGKMMLPDVRDIDKLDGECENGCDAFPSTRFMRSYEAIESLSEDAMWEKEKFRCTTVGCGATGSSGKKCPVCENYSMIPNE